MVIALLGDRSVRLAGVVRPGESADLGIDLTAPEKKGSYLSYWMLADSDGDRFGIGKKADEAFWVDIKVLSPNSNYAYDFATNICTASWRSSAGDLTCPSPTGSDAGSVALLDRPTLENDRTEDEFTLWTRPQTNRGGWINGAYPAYKVKEGDHFLADVGCLSNNEGCGVTFTLDYIQSNGRLKNLGEWYEAYDGKITRINVDLSSLAGNSVQFVLGVINEGRPGRANAFWLAPSIRKAAPPTPTATPTKTPVPTFTPTPPDNSTEPTPNPGNNPAVVAAQLKVAQDLGTNPSALLVMSVQAIQWSNSCLDIPFTDISCAAVIVPGYRIMLGNTDEIIEARTNQDGSLVYWFRP